MSPDKRHESELDERLEEAAERAQVPHDDEEERRRAKENAERAGESPRRQGEGVHPGMH